MNNSYQVIIIGGGVVGLAVALEITQRYPDLNLLVLEKEDQVARHQSGHNSGVIHSGIYYKPGSLKAKLCVAGARAMVEFCRKHNVPHNVCGKVIVATRAEELPRLSELKSRAEANGLVGVREISPEELREFEPHARGVGALHIPSTGVTDFAQVCGKYAELISAHGATVLTSAGVRGIRRSPTEIVIETEREEYTAASAINCAGLHSDRVAKMAGDKPGITVVPFRGEYYDLIPQRADLVRSLIYPVPDPRFPFLGVHFTRRISGKVDAGPNAVLAWSREGYRHTDVNLEDVASWIGFAGFWRMGMRNWRDGIGEFYRSFYKPAFVRALQRMLPEVRESDLVPGSAGVRAQTLKPDGTLLDDFHLLPSGNMLHVLNAPSPAATASLMIAKTVVDVAAEHSILKATHAVR